VFAKKWLVMIFMLYILFRIGLFQKQALRVCRFIMLHACF